jgi:choline dehydrogenase-like flavoprotein
MIGPSRVDLKLSFGNCLDNSNEIKPAPPFGYVSEITFGNLSWMDGLRDSRFRALAGWQKDFGQIFEVLNHVTREIFPQFQNDGQGARPQDEIWYGQGGKGFGWGTVHHAAGTLRMPHRAAHDSPFESHSVVDEDLKVVGTQNLYVCDMSVMPFSSAANPVRTLAALALRLSRHLA